MLIKMAEQCTPATVPPGLCWFSKPWSELIIPAAEPDSWWNPSKFMNRTGDQADGPSPKSWLHQFHSEEVFTGCWVQMNRWGIHTHSSLSFRRLGSRWHTTVSSARGSLFSQHTQGHWVDRSAILGPAQSLCHRKNFWSGSILPAKLSEPHPGVVPRYNNGKSASERK